MYMYLSSGPCSSFLLYSTLDAETSLHLEGTYHLSMPRCSMSLALSQVSCATWCKVAPVDLTGI